MNDAIKQNVIKLQNANATPQDIESYVKSAVSESGSQPQENNQPNTLQDLGGSLMNRASDVVNTYKDESSAALKNPSEFAQRGMLTGLHVAGQVAGGIGDLVSIPMKHLVSSIGRQTPINPTTGTHFIPTSQDLEKSANDLGLTQSVQNFQQDNPMLSRAIGDVGNIASAVPILKGFNNIYGGVKSTFSSMRADPLSTNLVETGAASDIEAPKLSSTLRDNGLNDLSPRTVAITKNNLQNSLSNLVDYYNKLPPDSPEIQGIQGQMQILDNAQRALGQMSSVPDQVSNPGLISRLATSAKDAGTYPFKHPLKFITGAGGLGYVGDQIYNTYQKLGGVNLKGNQ